MALHGRHRAGGRVTAGGGQGEEGPAVSEAEGKEPAGVRKGTEDAAEEQSPRKGKKVGPCAHVCDPGTYKVAGVTALRGEQPGLAGMERREAGGQPLLCKADLPALRRGWGDKGYH